MESFVPQEDDSMLLYEKKKNTLTVKLRGELDHSVAAGVRADVCALSVNDG